MMSESENNSWCNEFENWRECCYYWTVKLGGFLKFDRPPFRAGLGAVLFLSLTVSSQAAPREYLHAQVPSVVTKLTPTGRVPATKQLNLSIGLPLRNQSALDDLLRQLYDPASPNFHRFLAPKEFAERFGPTEQDYQAVIKFAESNGLAITGLHPNRVVLDVEGNVSNVEQAFQTTLHTYRDPKEARNFFAPDAAPSVPANLSVVTVEGLDDYQPPKPLSHKIDPLKVRPLNGSAPGGYYAGNDFRNAYVPGTTLTGAGQSVALLEFSSYYQSDIISYENMIGLTNYVPLNNVVIGRSPGSANNDEVALDIEVAIAMAPGLSQVIVYETRSSASSILSSMADDDLAMQLSSSWTWGGGPSTTIDNILKQMAAQGQSFFQAAGDSDAYTGSQTLDNFFRSTAPVDSTNLTCVGGTTLTMNGNGVSWSSETVWNWNNSGQPNVGSGGGISTYYTIPYWQAKVSMASNSGSIVWRNIPDVALTADNVFVNYNHGDSDGFGGTSCAAPLWAGFCALVNQQSVAVNGTTVGFLSPALYAIANSGDYTNCFHDITTGNNIGSGTPGLFYAVAGYDLCTGLGTPNGTNLINALAPLPSPPYFIAQPASQTATNGYNVAFGVTVGGQGPFGYLWQFNGTNLPANGNVSGVTSSNLSITSITFDNAGDYLVIVTNNYGSATSSVAALTVVWPPSFATQPTNLTVAAGSNAVFSTAVSGATPLAYRWQKNGANVFNGGKISGANSNVLTIASVSTNNSGNYTLTVTNIYGSITSSVAALTVAQPAAITVSLTNQTVQCGGDAMFSVTATGTMPLNYQWSLDGAVVATGTNSSLSLTDVHEPDHFVSVLVTNLYGSASNTVLLAVQDTLAPVITLLNTNPFYVELGSAFVDPGATGDDACSGIVPVTVTGAVNTSIVGTNTLTYTANDGNGNTNSVTRTVIVRDTTPPTVLWSFTNLVVAADTNCSALMPDVTGTNFIDATDLSPPLTTTQSPTNGTLLPLGTNPVVIAVSDAYSNTAYSFNSVVVRDQTPPVFTIQPQSRTNLTGSTADFSGVANACTPTAYQWFLYDAPLAAETNSTLTISNVTSAAGGHYFVVASADGGSTTSHVATLVVDLAAPILDVVSSKNPSGFKDNLNFTASVSPTNVTGTIQFLTNGAAFDVEPLLAGTAASTNLSSLPRGTNTVTAIYSGDANDLPATNALSQIVTNHPPTAADVYFDRQAGYPLAISVADLTTNWSDVDGDTVSLASIGVSTNGVTITNNAGSLVYSDTNNVDDLFVCTISDGWGGTNFQTVYIDIVLTNTIPTIIGVGNGSNSGVTLSLSGAPGYTYILEATTNLLPPANWLPLDTNTLGTNGLWQFIDTDFTNFPQRFYRLKLEQ